MLLKKIIIYFIIITGLIYPSSCIKYFPMPTQDGLVVVIPFCKKGETKGIYYGDFAITKLSYDATSNWDKITQEVFGDKYRVADWNDLEIFYYEKNGDLLKLFDGLNLKEYKSSASIKRNGDIHWNGDTQKDDRFYYASRHEHNKPSYYLDHENIDNNLISLGSWSGKRRIMVVKKSFKLIKSLLISICLLFE